MAASLDVVAPRITVHFLPEGRAALESGESRERVFDVCLVRVDDAAAIRENLRRWATLTGSDPLPRREVLTRFPDLRYAYSVTLENLDRLLGQESLRDGFDAALVREGPERAAAVDLAAVDRFAEDLRRAMVSFDARCRRTAEARLAGGSYLEVLRTTLTGLRSLRSVEDQGFYEASEHGVRRIMEDERYLLLADDPRARDLYRAIQDELTDMYNWWMDLARGGVKRAR